MKFRDIIIILLLVYFVSRLLENNPNWEKVRTLKRQVKRNFQNFLRDIEDMGLTPIIISSHRTYQEQKILHDKDNRNAPPGSSTHEMDTGIDIIVFNKRGKVLDKSSPREKWLSSGIPQIAVNRYGMRWGGDFKGYADNNHFDYLIR